MMTAHKLLLGLLIAQSAAAAATWWPDDATAPARQVFAEGERFDRLVIRGVTTPDAPAGDPLVLVRDGDGWVSETHGGYPVRDGALDGLLDTLDGLVVHHPVATQARHHARLDVADDQHQRRIDVTAGGPVRTLLLGAAQGNASHLRIDGGDAVYRVRGLSASSVPDSPGRLFERRLVDLDVAAIETFALERPDGSGWSVEKTDDGWTSPQLVEGQTLDVDALDTLLKAVARTRMDRPLTRDEAAQGLDEGLVVRWTVEDDGASVPGGFTVGALDGDHRYLRVLDSEHIVRVRDSALDEALWEGGVPLEGEG